MRIGYFEDSFCHQFQPLVRLRPVFDLRSGIFLIREKTRLRFPHHNPSFFVRDIIQPLVAAQYPEIPVNKLLPEDHLLVNGRLLPDQAFCAVLSDLRDDTLVFINNEIAAARITPGSMGLLAFDSEGLLSFEVCRGFRQIRYDNPGPVMLHYSWDLITANGSQIEADFRLGPGTGFCEGILDEGAYLLEAGKIYIARGARIFPGVVITAENGPVYIDEGTTVLPNTFIQGPVYIGSNCMVKASSKIYGGTSVGPVCKIGGEIEGSILHSYSNKQHEGFLGHAYLGQWVNLGADTNNSDLKNNYGNVKSYSNGIETDTGMLFMGLILGDHAKTGINSMLNTGTVGGMMCNLYGSGFPPKFIPDFSWGGAEGLVPYQIDKAIETAKAVMARRKKTMEPEMESLIRKWYTLLNAASG